MLKLESQNTIDEQNLNEKVWEVSFQLTKKEIQKTNKTVSLTCHTPLSIILRRMWLPLYANHFHTKLKWYVKFWNKYQKILTCNVIYFSAILYLGKKCTNHSLKYIKQELRCDGIIMDTMFIWVLKWICSTKRNINTECIEWIAV